LRAIPGRIVAWVTITEAIPEVVAKEDATGADEGAAPEPTELPIEAGSKWPPEKPSTAEVCSCERMASTNVAAASVSTCGHRDLCNPDGERGGEGEES
jgi:hypothetical protein